MPPMTQGCLMGRACALVAGLALATRVSLIWTTIPGLPITGVFCSSFITAHKNILGHKKKISASSCKMSNFLLGSFRIENDTVVNSFGYVQFGSALVAGGIAGVAVDASLYPIDTIKTRLQSERGLWKTGGFRGIYRGLSAVCVGSFPTAALFFVTYEASKSILMSHLPKKFEPVSHMVAASSGEVIACLFRVPCEIAKQRAQASKDSPLKHLRVAFKQEGFAGLYRGYLSTVLREVPFSFLQFPMWEFLKAKWSQIEGHQIDAWQSAVCGAGSGAFAASLTTPLDVAKTRIMLAKTGTPFAKNNIIFALKEIRKEHGISGWFAGMVPRVFWISLGGAIFLGVYDKVLSLEKAVFVDKIS